MGTLATVAGTLVSVSIGLSGAIKVDTLELDCADDAAATMRYED